MAAGRGRRVLLSLVGDPGDAKRAIREVRGELQRMSRQEASVRLDIQTARAQRALDAVNRQIEKYRAQKPSAEVELKITKALERAALIELRLDRLARKRVTIDVDVKRGALERTTAGLSSLERGVQGFGRGFANIFNQVPLVGGLLESALGGAFTIVKNLSGAFGTLVTNGVSRLGGALGSLAGPMGGLAGSALSLVGTLASVGAIAGGLVIVLNAVLGAVIALAGALTALVASAAAAVAGLGALAVAFGAALIPVAIVAIGVFTRFQAILKAHQAQQQQVAQATQDAKTAEQAHTAALEARKRAEEQLAQATVEGRKAMTQAAVDETDAELGLRNARNGVQGARLQLALAKRDLREFLAQSGASGSKASELVKQFSNVDFNPAGAAGAFGKATGKKVDPLDLRQKLQAVRDAQLGVANATNQVTHSEDTLAQARRKEADFTQRGIRAYRPYRQALEAVRRANERVARTQDQSSAAQRKYEQALKGLSTTERGTLSRLNSLIDGFKRLAKAFTDPVFRALNDVFDKLKSHAGDFTGALTNIGTAFGGVISAIGGFLTEPRTLSAFQTMATGAASLVTELGAHAFRSFLRIMREIATSALPAVQGAAHGVSTWLGRIAGQPARIHRAVGTVVDQFRTWARFAGAVARLVINLFGAAAPAGRSLASSMTRIVNHWADWVKQNPEKVREFFRNAVIRARQIVQGIKDAVTWLRDHLPKAAARAKTAFNEIATIVHAIYKDVKAAAGLMDLFSGGGSKKRKDPLHPRGPKPGTPLPLIIPEALKSLLGFASGGVVPGSGRGDIVPAMLEPGEFVLRRRIVQQLSLPVLHALNGGAVTMPAAAAMPAGGDANFYATIHTSAADDERTLIEKLHREYRRRFG